MEFEISKRRTLRPTFNGFWWWDMQKKCSSRKRQGPMAKKCCYIDFFWGKEKVKTGDETKEWSNLKILLQTALFGHTFNGFWCMVTPLGPHSVYA
jgi:hypothetical protein